MCVHVVVWCCVVLACCREHVVVLVVRVCVCGVWCGVRVVWCVCVVVGVWLCLVFGVVCVCVVWCVCVNVWSVARLGARKNPPVLMSSTPPCVDSKRLRV